MKRDFNLVLPTKISDVFVSIDFRYELVSFYLHSFLFPFCLSRFLSTLFSTLFVFNLFFFYIVSTLLAYSQFTANNFTTFV